MNAPTPTEPASDNSPGFFYWQLQPSQEQQLRAQDLIREEEGYLAHDINWGRALLDLRPDPTSVPPVIRQWTKPATTEHLSDAMSAILQVAVELGLDPEFLASRALYTHRAVREFASSAVRRAGPPDVDHAVEIIDDPPAE